MSKEENTSHPGITQITQSLGYTGDMARQVLDHYDDLTITDKRVFNTLMLTHPYDLRAVIQQNRESFSGLTATPVSFIVGPTHLTLKNPESKIGISPLPAKPLEREKI